MNAWRLAHLQDDGLDEVECNDISSNAAHGDAVAHIERVAAQDDEVACEAGNHLLESKREACPDQAYASGEPRGVIEPDRNEAKSAEHKCHKADALPGPEGQFVFGAPAAQACNSSQQLTGYKQQQEEEDREEELSAILHIDTEQLDPKDLDIVSGANKLDHRIGHSCEMQFYSGI